MMVRLAGVLARHTDMSAMTNGCNLVSALRLRALSVCLRRLRLLEVIGGNFLLSLRLHQERGENSNCQHES